MWFCQLREESGPLGPYGVVLPKKFRKTLKSRGVFLFIESRLNWFEDGLRVVLAAIVAGDGKVSDYLRLSYPETFTSVRLKTQTGESRKTLLYRWRYLLRCMDMVVDHFANFSQCNASPMLSMLRIFTHVVSQVVDEEKSKRLNELSDRFARLWSVDSTDLDDAESMRAEIRLLVDELEATFEMLHDAFVEKEHEHEEQAREASEIEKMRQVQEAANREHKQALRMCERLAERASGEEQADPYSRMVGLEGVSDACRDELMACFKLSHERFAIVRGDRSGAKSLARLAERTWRENREKFEAYAKLKVGPGYKDVRSLAAKLYKLAGKYPEADHFRWQT